MGVFNMGSYGEFCYILAWTFLGMDFIFLAWSFPWRELMNCEKMVLVESL
jgi:hypothetical protein